MYHLFIPVPPVTGRKGDLAFRNKPNETIWHLQQQEDKQRDGFKRWWERTEESQLS